MSEPQLRIGAGVPTPDARPVVATSPKKPSRLVLVVLAVALILAGAAVMTVVVLRSGKAPTAAPSPTVKTASVQQYAGVVNSSIKDIRETWGKYEDRHCVISDDKSDLTCVLGLSTLDAELQTLVLRLDNSASPKTTVYIGAPPAEIAQLVADTRAKAKSISDTIPELGTDGGDVRAVVWTEMGRMETILDRWDPYI